MSQLDKINLPILLISGCVDPFSNAYAMSLYEEGQSFNTMELALRQILLFYRFCEIEEIDFFDRMQTLKGFSVVEIESWYSFCLRRADNKHVARKSTIKMRLHYSYDFIRYWYEFFRDRAIVSIEKYEFAVKVLATMEIAFSKHKKKHRRHNGTEKEGLSPDLRKKFFRIIDPWPENYLNPWKWDHIRWRNYLLLLTYILNGPRRGEPLLLELDDLELDGTDPNYAIKHRERPPYPRKRPPCIKTLGRIVPLDENLAKLFVYYISHKRVKFRNHDKTTFLFLSGQDGGPLGLDTPNKILNTLIEKHPEYKGKLSPHPLRNTFHDLLYKNLTKKPHSSSPLVQQAYNLEIQTDAGGWAKNSTMPFRYTKGERKRRGHELQRKTQKMHIDSTKK